MQFGEQISIKLSLSAISKQYGKPAEVPHFDSQNDIGKPINSYFFQLYSLLLFSLKLFAI